MVRNSLSWQQLKSIPRLILLCIISSHLLFNSCSTGVKLGDEVPGWETKVQLWDCDRFVDPSEIGYVLGRVFQRFGARYGEWDEVWNDFNDLTIICRDKRWFSERHGYELTGLTRLDVQEVYFSEDNFTGLSQTALVHELMHVALNSLGFGADQQIVYEDRGKDYLYPVHVSPEGFPCYWDMATAKECVGLVPLETEIQLSLGEEGR